MVSKAKMINDELWVTGHYVECDGKGYIESVERNSSFRVRVDPDTVRRCTNLKTSDNQLIYEKDTVEYRTVKANSTEAVIETGMVVWSEIEMEWMITEADTKTYLKNVARNPLSEIKLKAEVEK